MVPLNEIKKNFYCARKGKTSLNTTAGARINNRFATCIHVAHSTWRIRSAFVVLCNQVFVWVAKYEKRIATLSLGDRGYGINGLAISMRNLSGESVSVVLRFYALTGKISNNF